MDELLDISRRLYEISVNIVRTETNTMKVLSRSQTTLDSILSPEDPSDDRKPNFPMEGYQ